MFRKSLSNYFKSPKKGQKERALLCQSIISNVLSSLPTSGGTSAKSS